MYHPALRLEKERQSHDTHTHESDEQDVRYKIGESTKRNTANQCNSVLLFPAIDQVPHADGTKDQTQEESRGVHNLVDVSRFILWPNNVEADQYHLLVVRIRHKQKEEKILPYSSLDLDVINFQFPVQVGSLHSNGCCGSRNVPLVFHQLIQDKLAFEFLSSLLPVQRVSLLGVHRRFDHGGGEVGKGNHLSRNHDGQTLYRILELPDVAGPVVRFQFLHSLGRDPFFGFSIASAEALHEVIHQFRNVFLSLS